MSATTRILFLSANPWTTGRILVDEEAREIFEKLQEGSFRDRFILYNHAAIRAEDIQRLLMTYRPHILHFSGHGSKKHKIILGGLPGRGKQIERQALAGALALYRQHLQLVFLNACFTRTQARSLSAVIDYSIGSTKPIGDKEGVAFAGAFYRALAFGNSVREAFDSATAEMALMNLKRARGLELFVRDGVSERDRFPYSASDPAVHPTNGSTLAPSNPEILTDPNAIDRWQASILGRGGEVRRSEQLIWSYHTMQMLVADGRKAFDQPPSELPIPLRSTRSRRLPIGIAVDSETAPVVRAATAVTVERRVVTLSKAPVNRQRTRANSSVRQAGPSKSPRRQTRNKRS